MAITPRTILTTPATAAIAAASLLAMTAAGMYAMSMCGMTCNKGAMVMDDEVVQHPFSVCDHAKPAGVHQADWSELEWFQYAACFDQLKDSAGVVEAVNEGLGFYPASESLYNLKGYHLILMGEHSRAVETLEEGMRQVGYPRTGTMPNNLAWAGLWVPREMRTERARELYKLSLALEKNVCETIHTGMWVEYAIAKQSQGIERVDALRKLSDLRERYEPCHNRYQSGEWAQVVEVLGAAVLYADIDGELGVAQHRDNALLHNVAQMASYTAYSKSNDEICREAVPTDSAHHLCVDMLNNAQVAKKPCGKRARKAQVRF